MSNCTDMSYMFCYAGQNVTGAFTITNINNWNTANVTSFAALFNGIGQNASSLNIGDISGWNTSKVKNLEILLSFAGREKITKFNVGNLGKWDVSNNESMWCMINHSGHFASSWTPGSLQNWKTSKCKSMYATFAYAGYYASWSLNLRSWDVSKVTNYTNFKLGNESKSTSPNF